MNQELSLKIKNISFLLIILVVYFHSYNLDNTNKGLYPFFIVYIEDLISDSIGKSAIPIFFIISGYLFSLNINGIKDIVIKLKKRFFTLFIPFVIWSLLVILMYWLIGYFDISKSLITNQVNNIHNYSLTELLVKNLIIPHAFHLWFLKDLIFTFLLMPIFYFLNKRIKIILLVFLFLFWFLKMDFVYISSEALLFVFFGSFLSQYNVSVQQKINFRHIIFITILWFFIMSINIIFQLKSYTLINIHILLGIISIWYTYDYIKNIFQFQFYTKIKNYTFSIYLFHEPLLLFLKKLVLKVTVVNNFLLVTYLILPIIVILICYSIAILLQNKIPKIYSILVGGRL